MADNSQYPITGFDVANVPIENTINSWSAAAKYFKFVYILAGVGQNASKTFAQTAQAAKAAGFLVGAYYDIFAGVPIGFHVATLQQQIQAAGFSMDLPHAIDYEKEPAGKNGAMIFDDAGRVDSFYNQILQAFPNQNALVYTNINGLQIMQGAGLSMAKYNYWISEAYAKQSEQGEFPISAIITNAAKLGIPQANILFAQTAWALPYPDPAISPDKGCDWDRVVSYNLPIPAPTPTPTPTTYKLSDALTLDTPLPAHDSNGNPCLVK